LSKFLFRTSKLQLTRVKEHTAELKAWRAKVKALSAQPGSKPNEPEDDTQRELDRESEKLAAEEPDKKESDNEEEEEGGSEENKDSEDEDSEDNDSENDDSEDSEDEKECSFISEKDTQGSGGGSSMVPNDESVEAQEHSPSAWLVTNGEGHFELQTASDCERTASDCRSVPIAAVPTSATYSVAKAIAILQSAEVTAPITEEEALILQIKRGMASVPVSYRAFEEACTLPTAITEAMADSAGSIQGLRILLARLTQT
jgi:cobalamin biosynthesis protein CobT